MKILTREEKSAVAILDLEGPLTLTADTSCLGATLDELLRLGVERIVLNMSAVSCLDCAGIGRLLGFREKVVSAGGGLRLIGLEPRHRTLLDLFHLTPILEVCESERSAVASFFQQSRILQFARPDSMPATWIDSMESRIAVSGR